MMRLMRLPVIVVWAGIAGGGAAVGGGAGICAPHRHGGHHRDGDTCPSGNSSFSCKPSPRNLCETTGTLPLTPVYSLRRIAGAEKPIQCCVRRSNFSVAA